jgi:hypothetical protein
MKFTKWHRVGLYLAMLMVCMCLISYIPKIVHRKLSADQFAHTQGNPVWLERNNNMARGNYLAECKTMPKLEGDSPLTCAGEAFSLFPDRNWKQVAEENMKKDLK